MPNGDIYKRQSGSWVLVTNIGGPAGASSTVAGPTGATGAPGPAGATGPSGAVTWPFQVYQSNAALGVSVILPNVVAGHFIAVLANNSNVITGCSDGVNTYTKIVGGGPTDGTYGTLYFTKATTSGSLTITFGGTASYANIAAFEFSASITGTVDVSGTATTPAGISLTTTHNNEVVIAGIAFSHSANASLYGVAPVVLFIGIGTSDATSIGGFFASVAGTYMCNFIFNGTITDGVVLAGSLY